MPTPTESWKTSNVFLDTAAFEAHTHNYLSAAFMTLKTLAIRGRVNIFLTEITQSEIRAHIGRDIKKSQVALAKVKKGIPSNSSNLRAACDSIDWQRIEAGLLFQHKTYVELTKATVLPHSGGTLSGVLEKYFSGTPPFGEGKKKAEFPDAFAIASLEEWCEEHQEKMYVISADPDMVAACEQSEWLISLTGINDFLSLFPDQVLATALESSLRDTFFIVEDAVRATFPDGQFYTDDLDGSVEEVVVESMDLCDNIHVIEADEGKAILAFDLDVLYRAHVTYDVPGTGYYDKEDHRLHAVEFETRWFHNHQLVSGTVNVSYDIDDPYEFEYDETLIEQDQMIPVRADDEAWW